jgi:Ca2+-binding EF-hand superfamily protein
MYSKVDVADFEGVDEPMDPNGYLGKTKFYRDQIHFRPISSGEMIRIIAADNKLDKIMFVVGQIDKDHNGYVTSTELDDILKLNYPDEFGDKMLAPVIKKFSSVQNRILIDYKGFRDWVKIEVSKLNS